jgi:hypothetical protein
MEWSKKAFILKGTSEKKGTCKQFPAVDNPKAKAQKAVVDFSI